MDLLRILLLVVGGFLLAYGLSAYRYFYYILGASTGLVMGMVSRRTLLKLPGLADNPGIASVLIFALFVLIGMFMATRLRRILAFLAGIGTGAIGYRAIFSLLSGSSLTAGMFEVESLGLMELLAGLVIGVLFLLFEGVFALILTSAVGAAMCTAALGGRWTFPACLLIGLIAQPLISRRFVPEARPGPGGGRGKSGGRTTTISLLLILLLPVPPSLAMGKIDRINPSSGRVTIDRGSRHGIKVGQDLAVMDKGGNLLAVIAIAEVYTAAAYSAPLTADRLNRIKVGQKVITLEDYDFSLVKGSREVDRLLGFMRKYPESGHNGEIEAAVDRIRFKRAASENTINSFRDFRRRYPGSRYVEEALSREIQLALDRAVSGGTEEDFVRFMDDYPGSKTLSGIQEIRLYLRARGEDRVYAYQEFLARFPDSPLSGACRERIAEFEHWADQLEFGGQPVQAIRFFGNYGDPTAVPLLIGKLGHPELAQEARGAILDIGEPAVKLLMEVLISPLQKVSLKDEAASILAELGDVYAVPALRTYVASYGTEPGRKALMVLEEKFN